MPFKKAYTSAIFGLFEIFWTAEHALVNLLQLESIMEMKQLHDNNAVIIGYSARLPGCKNVDDFWQLLIQQHNVFSQTPEDRLQYMHEHNGAFIEGIDEFDAAFFNISPMEAKLMDPQQRLLLQEVWRALAMAGIDPAELKGSNTGVYVGASHYDYSALLMRNQVPNSYLQIATARNALANRISYFFDLSGPSETVDTACSSSLYALDKAVKAITQGEIDLALVCASNLLLDDELFNAFNQSKMVSVSKVCKPFDSDADGYLRGEGIIVIVVQKQSSALQKNASIYAKIMASGVNHSSRNSLLTMPSAKTQQQLYEEIYANVAINRVSYIEAHGTGTKINDAIELEGLRNFVVGKKVAIQIGSVKSTIGHLEAASGLAGLLKILLMFQHQTIPGQANVSELTSNPALHYSGLSISQQTQAWPQIFSMPRCAGISSFGFGGVNVHVVLEQGIQVPVQSKPVPVFARKKYWFQTTINQFVYAPVEVLADDKMHKQLVSNETILIIYSSCFEQTIQTITRQLASSNKVLTYLLDDFNSNQFQLFLATQEVVDRIILYPELEVFLPEINLFQEDFLRQIHAVFDLIQALVKSAYAAKHLNLEVYSLAPDACHPEAALLAGLLDSLAKELPLWRIKHLQSDHSLDLSMLYTYYDNSGQTIRYHHGHYYVNSLSLVNPQEDNEFLSSDAVYLILGGMGQIGRQLVHFLVEQYQAKIIIVGHSALDKEGQSFVSSFGTAIEFIQTDVTRESECALLVKYLQLKYSEIHTVFDLVLKQEDTSLEVMTWNAFSEVVNTKLLSAYLIHQLQQQLPIKSAVIFSSMHSYSSAVGQANYAAATRALDAYCLQLHKNTGLEYKIINWSSWQDGLSTQQAFEAMQFGLSMEYPQFAIQKINDGACDKKLEQPSVINEELHVEETHVQEQPNEGAQIINNIITIFIRSALRLTEGQVLDTKTTFVDIGLDSLKGVTLITNINQTFNLFLQKSILSEYSTLDSLVGFVQSQLAKQGQMGKKNPTIAVHLRDVARNF